MPIIQHSNLPAYQKLINQGVDIRPDNNQLTINIGLLNMMPDAALEPTERQFLKLLSISDSPIKFYPFSINGLERSKLGQQHLDTHYHDFKELQQRQHLHALIISGSNVPRGRMSQAPFWLGLTQTFRWLHDHDIPTLFTCLATHAALEFFYQQKRQLMPEKCWGVFQHRLTTAHPLVNSLDEIIYVPHSRYNVITMEQFETAKLTPLIVSDNVGIHLAICNDHPYTFFQGHSEYDTISLLKEYKREIVLFAHSQRPDYPKMPENYLNANAVELIAEFKDFFTHQSKSKQIEAVSQFPENTIVQYIKDNWSQSGSILMNNWVNQIKQFYALTH